MTTALTRGEYVTVDGYSGVAFAYLGEHTIEREPPPFCDRHGHMDACDEDCEDLIVWPDEPEVVPTGMARVVMVGDDHVHIVDFDDITPYDEPVCSCGQLGCRWHLAE